MTSNNIIIPDVVEQENINESSLDYSKTKSPDILRFTDHEIETLSSQMASLFNQIESSKHILGEHYNIEVCIEPEVVIRPKIVVKLEPR